MNEAAALLIPSIVKLIEQALSIAKNREEEAIAYLRGVIGAEEEDRILIALAVIKAKAIKELSNT